MIHRRSMTNQIQLHGSLQLQPGTRTRIVASGPIELKQIRTVMTLSVLHSTSSTFSKIRHVIAEVPMTTGKPRRLGLDVGDKRIGIAISDPHGLTAAGLETITRHSPEEDTEKIADIAKR